MPSRETTLDERRALAMGQPISKLDEPPVDEAPDGTPLAGNEDPAPAEPSESDKEESDAPSKRRATTKK